ncbi:hypothetical protein BX600DRAFT_297625 [Xylariales sp. PMI_506]|nr:hypothetical protein BX600DRAFT_297625 [Xylariales sp. PMI_506]
MARRRFVGCFVSLQLADWKTLVGCGAARVKASSESSIPTLPAAPVLRKSVFLSSSALLYFLSAYPPSSRLNAAVFFYFFYLVPSDTLCISFISSLWCLC